MEAKSYLTTITSDNINASEQTFLMVLQCIHNATEHFSYYRHHNDLNQYVN